jgi:hypothetical protein
MNDRIITVLSSVPKEILITCAIRLQKKMSTRECVKVGNLRKLYGPDSTFKIWLKDINNLYVGRAGRIFITENGEKKYFGYEGSKWANPFTIKKYSLDECLKLYQEYIIEKIGEDPDIYNLDELKGKRLGCWCDPKDRCHVDILLKLII